MKKIVWGLLFTIVIGTLSCFTCPVFAEENTVIKGKGEEINLYATAAVLIDAVSGRLLYGKNYDIPMPMASTTKIMTCILVLENADIENTLTVSGYASEMPKVKLYLRKGEEYRIKDLLYSLMLESHNDSAVALAEYVGKQYVDAELSVKPTDQYSGEESKQAISKFAELMNRKAVEIGCENTWFITPNGLDATQDFLLKDGTTITKEHETTAYELAKIMAYCISKSPKSEAFLKITGCPEYTFSANGRSFSCTNHNRFLTMMNGALSGKTGFTNKAGYCYVGALTRDDRTFVVALLACGWPNHKDYKWSDTKKLMQYGVDHYFYRSFSEKRGACENDWLKPIPVRKGQTDILGETAYTEVRIAGSKGLENDSMDFVAGGTTEEDPEGLLLNENEDIEVECCRREYLTAPIKAGMEVGEITYRVDDDIYRCEKIVAVSNIPEIDWAWCIRQVLVRWMLG